MNMKSFLAMSFAALVLASPAWAEDKPAEVPDLSKMGAWSRKPTPTDEKRIKKEIEDFFKQEEGVFQNRDFAEALARVDFPLYNISDNSKGAVQAELYDQAKYTALWKPFYDTLPKDTKVTHKPTVLVLSDTMATATDYYTISIGKKKYAGDASYLVVKTGGRWKWKMMAEAGWGE